MLAGGIGWACSTGVAATVVSALFIVAIGDTFGGIANTVDIADGIGRANAA